MSTGVIIAIVVIAVLIVLAALLIMRPRMQRRGAERRMEERRTQAADRHRAEAEQREARAQIAEQEARRARAEAELHASRAEMHERGMADDALGDSGDTRFQRDRELLGDADRDGDGRVDAAETDRGMAADRDVPAAEETRAQTTSTTRPERS